MTQYYVIGGILKNINGHEQFVLACTRNAEEPYIIVDDIIRYFIIWQNSHLYLVEDDYSLSLVAPSPEAQQMGVKAPEKVWPDANLLERLRAVIKHGTSPTTPDKNGKGVT